MNRHQTGILGKAGRYLGLVATLVAVAPCFGDPAIPSSQPGSVAATESQREAAAIFRRMADYLAGLKTFSVNFIDGYDVVQASGQKVEFGEHRSVLIERPNRMRVEEISSDGQHDLALFDGKKVTAYNADRQVYAEAPQPGSVDDSLVYFVRDLRMRMPLALLFTTRLPEDLPGRITAIDYVESTDLWGMPADHIAGQTDNVDFQFWIRRGSEPLPLRIVITYRHEPGQPQFWANLSEWNTAPLLRKSSFEFVKPQDARKIAFAVQSPLAPPATKSEMQP